MKRGDETIILSSRVGPDLLEQTKRDLGALLEVWLGDAFILAEYGHEVEAGIIGRLVADVEYAAHDWLTWLSEKEATERSGHAAPWFRQRFKHWEERGHARKGAHGREYRAVVIPEGEKRRVAPADLPGLEAALRGERMPRRSADAKRKS